MRIEKPTLRGGLLYQAHSWKVQVCPPLGLLSEKAWNNPGCFGSFDPCTIPPFHCLLPNPRPCHRRRSPTDKSLCANEGSSDAPVDAVRALFAAAVQRAAESRWRRDTMEDCCNEVAAKNQAAAAELAERRAVASRAEVSLLLGSS